MMSVITLCHHQANADCKITDNTEVVFFLCPNQNQIIDNWVVHQVNCILCIYAYMSN